MIGPRIFVGFAEEVQRDRLFAQQLVDDLRDAGNDVALLTNSEKAVEDDAFIHTLNQQLAACEYVLFILSPEALHSAKVQMIVNTALNLVVRQRIRGVFALLATPIDVQDMPPTWTTIRVFDATQDYPRAFARVQLALTPITATSLATPPPAQQPLAPTLQEPTQPVLPPSFDRPLTPLSPIRPPRVRQQRFRIWSALVVLVSVLGLTIGLITYTTYANHKKADANLVQKTQNPVATLVATATRGFTPTAVATRVPMPTAIATAFPNTPQGLYASVLQSQPLIVDPLSQPDNNQWDITTSNGAGSCQFVNGAYDITSIKAGHRQPCVMKNNPFQNFALQGQMSYVAGPGPCGLIARKQGSTVMSYRLNYYANGDYEFLGPEYAPGHPLTLVKRTPAPASTQPVTLTLIAKNDTFYLYINGQFAASAKDATFASGTLGFICRDNPSPTEARFTNAKIWNL